MSDLSDTHQMMIVNAACHAIAMNQEIERMAIAEKLRPSILHAPSISRDGGQWCALYGEDLVQGVAGFGDTPEKAMLAFDQAWINEEEGQ